MTYYAIPKALIAHYLGGYVDDMVMTEDEDPHDPAFAEKCFQEVKLELIKFNEQDYLAAGLMKLLSDIEPEDYMSYSSQEESLTDEDMKYLVDTLYTKSKPLNFDENAEVEITKQTLKDWRIANGFYYKTRNGDSFYSIAMDLGLDANLLASLNKPDFDECGLFNPIASDIVITKGKANWS